MISGKSQKAFLNERLMLLKDCRDYNKTIMKLREALQSAKDRYRAALLLGLVLGGLIVELIRYIQGA